MEENKNIELEKEEQELLDNLSRASSRSIERRRTMDSFQRIEEALQYLIDLSVFLGMKEIIEMPGVKSQKAIDRFKEVDKKLLYKYGFFDFTIHNRVIKSLKFKENELNELIDLVEILDFNQKYSIFDLINDPGILSDEKERKLLVKYFGKAVWEKVGGKTC